jgi:hypothetical protein
LSLAQCAMIGSTIRQHCSTSSERMNRVGSPTSASSNSRSYASGDSFGEGGAVGECHRRRPDQEMMARYLGTEPQGDALVWLHPTGTPRQRWPAASPRPSSSGSGWLGSGAGRTESRAGRPARRPRVVQGDRNSEVPMPIAQAGARRTLPVSPMNRNASTSTMIPAALTTRNAPTAMATAPSAGR